ncbi:hypothetical protein GJ744_008197 [Endocarpon pusillum]|uniref:Mediator complex subunit 15 KIX domain-containing protein n=1 Tax=Endocarpon pusillum TaxID=364733 RepID=A0A8H7AHS9_9EURO|nr:hypothetical protein GJ744_008197 [Endocarpon pusillum]
MNQAKMQNMGGFAGGGPGNLPQGNADAQNNQIMRFIIHSIQQQPPAPGWRAQVKSQERMHWIKQVIDSLRLLPQPSSDMAQVARIAVRFEQKAFDGANDKETYVRECQKKLGEIRDSRAQQANAQAHQAPGQNTSQRTQPMQQMGQNLPFPPQLQHQMQASPIPQSQGPQMGMNLNPAMAMQNGGGAPAARGMQQPNNPMQNQQPRPNPQTMPLKMTQEDHGAINQLAQKLAATTSPEDRRKIQQNLNSMPQEQLNNIRAKGVDPMAAYFRDRATKEWRRQQLALGGNPNFPSGMQMNPVAQAQRQPTPANMPNAQAGRGISGNGQSGGTPFLNNIDHFQGLQADGLRSQEQGQLVVPASNGQGINPEAFRLQQFVNNQQLAKQNSGGRINQQFISQQPLTAQIPPSQGLQQPQLEKANDAANIQAQSQAQAQAQARARADAVRAQQQVGMQHQQGLQGMSQSGTPLSVLTRPVGANVQGPAQPQPHGTPQPRPPSRALNPGQQSTPQMQQNFPQAGQQNTNQQAAPPLQALPGLPGGIPPQLQVLLSKHPQNKWREIIERFKQQAMQQSRYHTAAQPMSQTLSQPGHAAPTAHGQMLGDSGMASLPMQHSASAGAPIGQNPNQGVPQTQQMLFQQQPLPQRRQADLNRPQGPQMSGQQAPPSMIQPGNSLPDVPEGSIANMDQQLLPPQMYQNVVQKFNLPSQIKTWSHLKQYLSQNPHDTLPMEKILSVQKLHFQQMLRYMHSRNALVGDPSRSVSGQPGQPGAGPPPPLQMPPNMQDQRPQGLPQQNQMAMSMMGNLPPVTREEIQRARMSNAQLAQMPEPQVRAYLTAYRHSEARKRLGLSQPLPNNQQFTFMPGQTPAQPPNLGPSRQQQPPAGNAPGSVTGLNPQMRPGTTGARSQPTPAPGPGSHPVPQPQAAFTNQQSGRGMKRANDAEMTEVPNPNLASNAGLSQQAGTAQSGPAFRVLSKEEVSRLPPEQQKAYREKQNQHQSQMFFAHAARLTDEVRRASPSLQPLAMDANSRARIVKVLTAPGTQHMLTRFNGFLYQYFLMTRDSEMIKQLLSYRLHLIPQYTPASVKAGTWEPAERFSITADYAETAVKDLLLRFTHVMARVNQQQPAAHASPSDATGSHPLSADNLKKHQDMQAAQRAKRPAQEVPPAPTASRPPFAFTDASPRGQGTPRYAPGGLKQVQQEDLKLPKRQKKTHHDNTASTPVGGQATPTMSPQAIKVKVPDVLPFKCTVAGCESHDQGYATRAELDNHSKTAHRPVEEHIADPLAFFLESMREGLGLDENGESKAKPKPDAPKAPAMQKTSSKTAGLASKPSTPAPSASLMTRGASQASGGPKDASPNPSQLVGAKARPNNGENPAGAVVEPQGWNTSKVSLADVYSTFGDLVSGVPRISLNHHDPLSASNDMAEFMDQFMESEAWTKMQETPDTASSKATASPAQHSDRSSSDISKGDDVFIKIGAEDTELAESWALPDLHLEPVNLGDDGGATGKHEADEVEEWLKMDFGDASISNSMAIPTGTGGVDDGFVAEMDIEWKEVDWDRLLAPATAAQQEGHKAGGQGTGIGNGKK